MPVIKVVRSDLSALLIVSFYCVVVIASSRLKSGLALGLGLGLKFYFATFLGLYPTVVGGDLEEIGGLAMGGGRHIYGLSPASVVKFEKSGDDGAASFVSSV